MHNLKLIRVLQFLSALFGFTGTIVMVWGVLTSTPNDIAKLGGLHFGINPSYLRSIAESRANTTIGILFISVSFLFQIVIHLFEEKIYHFHFNPTKRIIKSCLIVLLVLISVVYLFHSKLIDNTIFSTHKEMAYLSLEKQFNYNKSNNQTQNGKVVLSKGQIDVIRNYMNDLSFKRKDRESEKEYFVRFYKYLKHGFAGEINFEKSGIK